MSDREEEARRRLTRIVPAEDYHQNRYAALLDETVRPGDRWLDLGAGSQLHGGWLGISQEDLAARARFIVGCDPVGEHLAGNPHLGARCRAIGEGIPLTDGCLDVVSANMVVEHLSDPLRVFSEVWRVLRPGGHFVFVTPNRTHPIVFSTSLVLHPSLRRLLAHVVERRELEHVFITFYRANTCTDVRRVAEETRFTVKRAETFCSLPFARRSRLGLMVEGSVIRLARKERFAFLRSNLLAWLEKPA